MTITAPTYSTGDFHFTNPVSLWIDAVCIDQFSLDERSRQVSLMHEIYTKATTVIAWLGPLNEYIHTTPHSHQPHLHSLLDRTRPLLRRKRLVGTHVDPAGNRPGPPGHHGSRAIRDNVDTLRTSFQHLSPGQLLRVAVRGTRCQPGSLRIFSS